MSTAEHTTTYIPEGGELVTPVTQAEQITYQIASHIYVALRNQHTDERAALSGVPTEQWVQLLARHEQEIEEYEAKYGSVLPGVLN